MPKENNKMQVDIENLLKQNVNDLLSIKELYSKLEELQEKITQIKYIDNTLVKKLKKEYEKLNKIILDENIQLKLTNDVETINSKLDNDIELINSQLDTKVNYLSPEMFGAKGDGVADDTNALKSLFNSNISDSKIILGKNKIYKSTQKIDCGAINNVEINGNGSQIVFYVNDECINFNIGELNNYKSLTITSPITVNIGDYNISLSSYDVSDVKIGDIAVLKGSVINGYTNAEIIEVTSVSNNVIGFKSFIDEKIDVSSIVFYKSSNNISVKNLQVKSTSPNAITIQFSQCKNLKVENCKVEGNGSRIGFIAQRCLYGEFLNNESINYYDKNIVDNRTGYGFAIEANNFYMLNCHTKNCKHHLTVATKSHKCHNVIFDNFKINANDSDCPVFWALADFHGNAIDCKFINGSISVSKDYKINNKSWYDCAFGIRGKRCSVENCTIIIPNNLENFHCACFYENAIEGGSFKNNTIIGKESKLMVRSSAFTTTEMVTISDFYITGNKGLGDIQIGDLTNTLLLNINILNNKCKGIIKCVGCSQNIIIDKNIIDTTHISDYHIDIQPHYKNLADKTGFNIVVSNNVTNHGEQNGRMVSNNSIAPIQVINNTFYSTGIAQIYKDDTYGELVQTLNNFKYDGSTFEEV